jgi:hypothetical protein
MAPESSRRAGSPPGLGSDLESADCTVDSNPPPSDGRPPAPHPVFKTVLEVAEARPMSEAAPWVIPRTHPSVRDRGSIWGSWHQRLAGRIRRREPAGVGIKFLNQKCREQDSNLHTFRY